MFYGRFVLGHTELCQRENGPSLPLGFNDTFAWMTLYKATHVTILSISSSVLHINS